MAYSDEERQWYTNKDLFEKLDSLKTEFNGLRSEMYEFRGLIQSYNALREQLETVRNENDDIKQIVNGIINGSQVKKTTINDLRVWGGWLFGLISLAILIYTTFK